MSSRALRKLQRGKEQENLHQIIAQSEKRDDEDESESDHVPTVQKSAFALLGDADDVDSDEDDEQAIIDNSTKAETQVVQTENDGTEPKSTTSRKPKKKKKRKTASKKVESNAPQTGRDMDEIDIALAELEVDNRSTTETPSAQDLVAEEACKLLSVDSQNLHAENEVRRLFGRSATESHDREQPNNQNDRRGNRAQQMGGLAAALGRRQGAQAGRSTGLGLLGLRKNLFIQGKEEWPMGTSGGLGMEIVERGADGIVQYRFVHNSMYQEVQSEFKTCVHRMDPEQMIHLLQLNPYHISTLLQVSEIAKQERDHSTSGDLLERALFSFGRTLHSTFAASLAQGKARLDFRRPENREFYLTVSRYMTNLTMRATWRTVCEWAKLLLSLDPENDPYCIRLIIDQYAIRAHQSQLLSDLSANPKLSQPWSILPNIQMSKALALIQIGQNGKGKQALFKAIGQFPWVAARLFQELNIDAPPGIWGKTPRTDWERLCMEVYVKSAKDIWNTPENTNMLIEVASAQNADTEQPIPSNQISIDEARHVILADKPDLIALVPQSLTAKLQSSSDPLPPEDNISSYTVRIASEQMSRHRLMENDEALLRHILADSADADIAEAVLADAPDQSGRIATIRRFLGLMEPERPSNSALSDNGQPDVIASEDEHATHDA